MMHRKTNHIIVIGNGKDVMLFDTKLLIKTLAKCVPMRELLV